MSFNKAVAMKGLTLSLLHLHFAFKFPAKKLDSIGVVVGGEHGDNRGKTRPLQ